MDKKDDKSAKPVAEKREMSAHEFFAARAQGGDVERAIAFLEGRPKGLQGEDAQ